MTRTSLKTVLIIGALLAMPFTRAHAQSDQVSVSSSSSASDTNTCSWEGCETPSATQTATQSMTQNLEQKLKQSAKDVEKEMRDKTDDMMKKLLERVNQTELDIIAWWKNMWAQNLDPSLKDMTDQITTAVADQSRVLQSASDSDVVNNDLANMTARDVEAKRDFTPAPNPCGDATIAGGQGRAASFSRAMRGGWEQNALKTGLNTKGTPGATGSLDAERKRYDDYKTTFCDPDGNGGKNDCPTGSSAPPAEFINADTQPTKFISEQLTIPVDADNQPDNLSTTEKEERQKNMSLTVETINNNLTGVPSADPMSPGAMSSAAGQQNFLDRRSYLARYAAIRSVPGLVTSWRMPGSKMGEWVKGLRQGDDASHPILPEESISKNPSYREIMHAETIDRFNSGKYAGKMVGGASENEMEKLTLNAFYLMQLRDYYELLERTALVLAVQVSMMADQEQSRTNDAALRAPVK